MKAQSAIEYLVTYGWMLIAVSTVSGVVYSSIGPECVESASGFTGDSVQVTNFGVSSSSNNISLMLENRKGEALEINRIEFESARDSRDLDVKKSLDPFEADSMGAPGFQQSDSCNKMNVKIIYDTGSLKNQQASGTLTADIEFDDTVAPITPTSFDSAYPNL